MIKLTIEFEKFYIRFEPISEFILDNLTVSKALRQ